MATTFSCCFNVLKLESFCALLARRDRSRTTKPLLALASTHQSWYFPCDGRTKTLSTLLRLSSFGSRLWDNLWFFRLFSGWYFSYDPCPRCMFRQSVKSWIYWNSNGCLWNHGLLTKL